MSIINPMSFHTMRVTKRNGQPEEVSFDKVIQRIRALCRMEPIIDNIDPIQISQRVITQIYDGVKTSELDELAAQICISRSTEDINYARLASRIIISNNQKTTSSSIYETVQKLYYNKDEIGNPAPLISKKVYDLVKKNRPIYQEMLDYSRDFLFDYFGFKTLENAYLLKVNKQVVERIQHMFLRVSIGLHGDNFEKVKETYDFMSQKYFTHATPTLFHSGTPHQQLLSCFLLGMDDNVDSMYKVLSDCAKISKWAGGIGIHVHDIRANGSRIRSTNGVSNGLVPLLRVYNDTARHINQSGKRNGSFAFYLEPWHSDIIDFLEAKKNHGDENARARDLFYAIWMPDLFMERVIEDADWSLMCPDKSRGLTDSYGDKFKELYEKYEQDPKYVVRKVKARDIWLSILTSQIETGTPYIVYKDAANKKSNQKNLGTIRSSNLCVAPETEILTKDGYFPICELEGKEIEVWNGNKWSNTKVIKTGENQELITISFSNGNQIDCTKYHKFYLKDGSCVEAKDLFIGNQLESWLDIDTQTINDITVINIIDNGRIDATYCVNEPLRHRVIFNGVLTGNCSEIIEYSDTKEYACCTLASIGLPTYLKPFDYNQLKEMKVEVYGKTNCPHCKYAKLFLKSHGIDYIEHIYDDNTERLEMYRILSEETGKNLTSVPQIFIGKEGEPRKHIGGFSSLLDYVLPTVDYKTLMKATKTLIYNLNKVVDINFYPVPETERSNKRHRPLGLGVQGLADLFALFNCGFDSPRAMELNKEIFAVIYYAAMEESIRLSEEMEEYYEKISSDSSLIETLDEYQTKEFNRPKGQRGSYISFKGSPLSNGQFQFDLWATEPIRETKYGNEPISLDWEKLRERVVKSGARNSLLLAPMPTASTSQILGYNEAIEPFTSNIYSRSTLAGNFVIVNRYLLDLLKRIGLWSNELKEQIIINNGSVMGLTQIPDYIRNVYKTAWDLSMKSVIDQAADRGVYVCQSQSLNLWLANADISKLSSMHVYGWRKGLKTGIYYLRTRAAAKAQQFTIDPTKIKKIKEDGEETPKVESKSDSEGCLMCSG